MANCTEPNVDGGANILWPQVLLPRAGEARMERVPGCWCALASSPHCVGVGVQAAVAISFALTRPHTGGPHKRLLPHARRQHAAAVHTASGSYLELTTVFLSRAPGGCDLQEAAEARRCYMCPGVWGEP
jgi:hypothetical protein